MFERPSSGERTLLIHLKLRNPSFTADLCEFRELAISAGAVVVDTVISGVHSLDPKLLIGKGKVEEIRAMILALDIHLVLFNHDLTSTQERNLEKSLQCRVLDRTGLILDIFSQRARTFEGKLHQQASQHGKTTRLRKSHPVKPRAIIPASPLARRERAAEGRVRDGR